ncbi:MAG: OmpH family outer membrane protein, partial [Alphaproteobacteria bacterium]
AGVCILSDAAVVGGSKVGQYANQKLQQLQTNVNAELNATNNQLSAERSNLQAQVAATSQTAQAAAIDAFQQKVATFQSTLEERSDQLDRTKENTYARILTLTEPFLQDIYEARNCSLLLDATGVLFANETMNITPDVITELDKRATEITVELAPTRAQLQAQQSSQAAPAATGGAAPAPSSGGAPARGPVGPRL